MTKAQKSSKNERWDFRVNESSDALVTEAAVLTGVTKTDFVVVSAVDRAQSVIAERQKVTMSPENFTRFVESLDGAPVAVPELVELFSRPSQIPPA
jgi:uncharacterized protein (DUF1778 family)